MISETHHWKFRDSLYRFVFNPRNYVPGFGLGVLYAVCRIAFTGLASNPLLAFIIHVITIIVLYMMVSIIREALLYRNMPPDQKALRWEIDAKSLKRTDGQGRETVVKWGRISHVKKTMSGYMLHRSIGAPIWIPVKLFTPDQQEIFDDLVMEALRPKEPGLKKKS